MADDLDDNGTKLAICGDGKVGEPSWHLGPWPCMTDFVCKGKSQASTHSRGMCQRGSQRWASGLDDTGADGDTGLPIKNSDGVPITKRDWRCILDNYYNDNSNSTGAGSGLRTAFSQGVAPYGKIAYTANNNIYVMNSDGSSAKRLTNEALDYMPTWSSDNTKIAFVGPQDGIFYINPDGSGEALITGIVTPGQAMCRPSWSKSGNDELLFYTQPAPYQPYQVYAVNANGSSLTQLTSGANPGNQDGNMSAYGAKIVYSCAGQICVMNADGSGVQQITHLSVPPYGSGEPRWSPDGQKIVFSTDTLGDQSWDLVVINADGSNLAQVTTPSYAGDHDINPSWLNNNQIVFASDRDHQPASYSVRDLSDER